MENSTNKQQEFSIETVVDRFLRSRPAEQAAAASSHLSEDTLANFVEGTLSQREGLPVVTHLASCSFCRHISAELIRLELEFAEEPVVETVAAAAPTSVADVLNNLISKIFGTNDGAVFAHNEDEKPAEKEKDETKE